MNFKELLLVLVCILSSVGVLAQQGRQQVTGVVVDNNNNYLPGVTIIVKGTSNGTTTDANGNFTLSVPNENATLIFSYIGFITQEVMSSRDMMKIVMTEDLQVLEEIVVIGYGSIRKSDLTGSVSNISSATIMSKPSSNPLSALQGKVAGMIVNNNTGIPGGTFRINIRGFNSINASNSPLFVIDGVIGADFSMLNAGDIESVDVLKDASATAIYGARGANGVIIVTTKMGNAGAAKVSYNGSVGIGYLSKDRKIPVLNSQEYLEMERQAWAYNPNRTMPNWAELEPELFNPDGSPKYDTDWQDEATRTALTTSHSLSVTGGTDKLQSALSLGYDNNQGILINTHYTKYTARMSNNFNVNRWLKADMNLGVAHTVNNDLLSDQVGSLSAARMMLEALPIIPVRRVNGRWGDNSLHLGTEGGEGPVKLLEEQTNQYNNTRAQGSFNITLMLAEGLEFKSSFSADIDWRKRNRYYGRDLRNISLNQEGDASITNNKNIYLQNENYMTYNNVFNDIHSVNVMVGASWNKYNAESLSAQSQGFADDFYQYHNLGVGSNPRPSSSGWNEWRMNSYFARINYALNNKYLFTATTRIDGSSRFGANNRYATFPSVAVAWRISEEDFLKSVEALSLLKLRASYGATGNDGITTFQALSSTGSYTAVFNGARFNGIGRGRIPNPDLRWERTDQFDAGLDLGLFRNRLNINIDYYYKKTVDLLLNAPVPASTGYTTVMRNIGNMENKGLELAIHALPVLNQDFSWNIDFVISTNNNKILKLGANNEDILMDPNFLENTNILRVGEAVNSFFGYERIGTWGTAEEAEAARYGRKPGDLKFRDQDNNGEINSNDKVIIGNGLPKFEGNLGTSFSYRNIDFSIDVSFKYGNDILRLDYSVVEDRQTLGNSLKTLKNAWRPDNQNTMIASVRVDSQGDGSVLMLNDHYVEDGSFIRGSNINLGYNFSGKWISQRNIQKLRLFLNAQNFFLITNYKGYDPETSTYTSTFNQGIEFMNYPKARIINVGVNLVF